MMDPPIRRKRQGKHQHRKLLIEESEGGSSSTYMDYT